MVPLCVLPILLVLMNVMVIDVHVTRDTKKKAENVYLYATKIRNRDKLSLITLSELQSSLPFRELSEFETPVQYLEHHFCSGAEQCLNKRRFSRRLSCIEKIFRFYLLPPRGT